MRLKPLLSDLATKQEEMGKASIVEEQESRVWLCILYSLCQSKVGDKKKKEFFRN